MKFTQPDDTMKNEEPTREIEPGMVILVALYVTALLGLIAWLTV